MRGAGIKRKNGEISEMKISALRFLYIYPLVGARNLSVSDWPSLLSYPGTSSLMLYRKEWYIRAGYIDTLFSKTRVPGYLQLSQSIPRLESLLRAMQCKAKQC